MYPNILFKIPIYSKSKKQYSNDQNIRLKKYIEENRENRIKSLFKLPKLDEKSLELQFYKYECRPWKYNLIIGWLEFYLDGKTLKAKYCFTTAKRISDQLKKIDLRDVGKISDVSITHTINNEEIKKDIKIFLEDLAKGKYIKKFERYFIDSEEFLTVLEYLDVKALIEHYSCSL